MVLHSQYTLSVQVGSALPTSGPTFFRFWAASSPPSLI
jgi:hypothetical protein